MRGGHLAEVAGFVAAACVLAALPLVANTSTLTVLAIYALLGLSLGLIWGFGGILCFGQAAFYGLGAYAYAIAAINIGESTVPMLIAIGLPALLAFALGALMFYGRISDVYVGVITLVVTLIFFKYMNATAGEGYMIGTARLGGFNGIPGFQTLNVPGDAGAYITGNAFYGVCAAALLLAYLGCRLLLASTFGHIVVAIRENEQRAQLMGYDTRAYKTWLFTIGGGIAGIAGALYANWAEIVTPGLFSLSQSAEVLIWVIVGGVGTLIGPIIGAVSLGYLKILLGAQQTLDNLLVFGAILVLTVLLLPRGVIPSLVKLWRWRRGASTSDTGSDRGHRGRRRRRAV